MRSRGETRNIASLAVLAIVGTTHTLACGAAAQLALKQPIVDQCASQGLKGCDELTDGVLAFTEGDKAKAEAKLRAAAAANEPEQLKTFATALKPIADNIGGDTGTALKSVIAILLDAGTKAPTERAAASTQEGKTADTVAAANDEKTPPTPPPPRFEKHDEHERIRTFTVLGGLGERATTCGAGPLASTSGACKRVRIGVGPMIVTNLYSSGGCRDELFVVAGRFEQPQWFVLSQPGAALNVAGQLVVDDGEELSVGARSTKDALHTDVHCSVTWAARTATGLGF